MTEWSSLGGSSQIHSHILTHNGDFWFVSWDTLAFVGSMRHHWHAETWLWEMLRHAPLGSVAGVSKNQSRVQYVRYTSLIKLPHRTLLFSSSLPQRPLGNRSRNPGSLQLREREVYGFIVCLGDNQMRSAFSQNIWPAHTHTHTLKEVWCSDVLNDRHYEA